MSRKMINIGKMRQMKAEGEKISVITAYDFPSARLAQDAGIDVILVGDSLGNVILGYDSTIPVTIGDMLHHTKAVTRGAPETFVVTDLPFLTYHGSMDRTLNHVGKLMQEGLAKSVKMEGGEEISETIAAVVKSGVPVMGHLGLTPQSVYQIGGYKIQGRTDAQAEKLLQDAKVLEQAGVYAIVLEMVPAELAQRISEQLSVPTIGIGAGAGCDGQVLVFHDLLQYHGPEARTKKFVKTYANLGEQIVEGLAHYIHDVKQMNFPGEEHSFHNEKRPVSVHLYGEK